MATIKLWIKRETDGDPLKIEISSNSDIADLINALYTYQGYKFERGSILDISFNGSKLSRAKTISPNTFDSPYIIHLQQAPGTPSIKFWTVGPRVHNNSYHVPFEKLQLPALIARVKSDRNLTLVQGGYRAGKTSHLTALYEALLQSYFPIQITFRYFDQNVQTAEIWQIVSNQIHDRIPNAPVFRNEHDFISFFCTKDNYNRYFNQKMAVLLLDEFQVISYHEDFRNRFLGCLKEILDHGTCFQCMLGFGTFSTLHLVNESRFRLRNKFSPIPHQTRILIETLPGDEIRKLFNEWADHRKITIDPRVIDSVIQETGCYAGLVSFVGLSLDSLDEITLPRGGTLSETLWYKRYDSLLNQLMSMDQFERVTKEINSQPQLKQFILQYILPFDGPYGVPMGDFDEIEAYGFLITLADYGLLKINMDSSFDIIAPVLYQLLLEKCYPHEVISFDLNAPYCTTQLIDVTLQHLSPTMLSQRECWNKTTQFPSEYMFQAEIYSILREGLRKIPSALNKELWSVLVESKSNNNHRRSDIFIQNGNRIIIEIKAAQFYDGQKDLLMKHINQAATYAADFYSDEVVLLNITSCKYEKRGGYLRDLDQIDTYPLKITASNGKNVLLMQAELQQDFKTYQWFYLSPETL